MKSLAEALGTRLKPRGARMALLQTVGFGVIAFGAGMIFLPAGVIVAGVSLIVLAGLSE